MLGRCSQSRMPPHVSSLELECLTMRSHRTSATLAALASSLATRQVQGHMSGAPITVPSQAPAYLTDNINLVANSGRHVLRSLTLTSEARPLPSVSWRHFRSDPDCKTRWYFMGCQCKHPPHISLGSLLFRRRILLSSVG